MKKAWAEELSNEGLLLEEVSLPSRTLDTNFQKDREHSFRTLEMSTLLTDLLLFPKGCVVLPHSLTTFQPNLLWSSTHIRSR